MHTEFTDVIHYAPEHTDVVVLAGDIGKGVHGIKWAKRSFPDLPIVYVAGNHEFYQGDIDDVNEFRQFAKKIDVHYLENDQVVINGVRFLGCTLWSNIDQWSTLKVESASRMMNDYQYITAKKWWGDKNNQRQAAKYLNLNIKALDKEIDFQPVVSYLLHKQSIAWLAEQLRKPFDGKTVVVSHHAPSYKSTEKETSVKRIRLKASYASSLEDFILQYQEALDLWVHGHVHQAVNYSIYGVPIRSNPRGYPVFNPMGTDQPFGFDDNSLIFI